MFGAARIQAVHQPLGARSRDVHRAGEDIVDAFAVGAIGREIAAPPIKVMAPRIHEPVAEDVQLLGLGAKSPDAAAIEPLYAVGRFHVAVNVDRLVHVQAAIRSPPQRVEQVMRVLGAESRQHDPRFVGFAVAVGVPQVNEVGAVGDVRAAIARRDAGGDQQAVGEHRRLVGLAVVIGVFEHEDLVRRGLTRLDLRIDFAGGDPEPSLGVEVHLDRLRHHRIGGPEVDFEAIGHHKCAAFNLGIGWRNVLQIPLAESGPGEKNANRQRRGGGETTNKPTQHDAHLDWARGETRPLASTRAACPINYSIDPARNSSPRVGPVRERGHSRTIT